MSDIRQIRRQLALTQTAMGERLGLNQSTISRMENGSLAVDRRTALAVEALAARVATCGTCERRADDPECANCIRTDCGLSQRKAA